MRVAVVCPYGLDRPGGVQDQAIRLAAWLRDDGHESWVVGPGESGPQGARLVGPVRAIAANRSRAPVALSPATGRRAVEAVADADVAHLHEPIMPMVCLQVLRRSPVPKVGTFHADPATAVRGFYRLASPLMARWAGRLGAATAVSTVAHRAVSPFVEARIIPNGLDEAAFTSTEERVAKRAVFVGRDEPRKGLDVLLHAWPVVAERIPQAELLVIGNTSRASSPGVRVVGAVDRARKRELLASSAVAVAPNTGGESFGLVVAEGMAAGCAVVASGLEAFAAVLGDTGILVAPGDPAGLADAIVALLSDAEGAAELGRRARHRARRFNHQEVTSAYLDAYRQAIKTQG